MYGMRIIHGLAQDYNTALDVLASRLRALQNEIDAIPESRLTLGANGRITELVVGGRVVPLFPADFNAE